MNPKIKIPAAASRQIRGELKQKLMARGYLRQQGRSLEDSLGAKIVAQ